MLKKQKKIKWNSRQVKQDVLTAYRRITWKIWVYLKANPDVLAENNNQEVYDEVARIQTDMYLRRNPDQTREDAFSTQDFLSDLEAKYNADDYYFEQGLMDLLRPSVEHNKAWGARMFMELFFYSGMPESYTKTVHNMVLAEEEVEHNLFRRNKKVQDSPAPK